MDLSLIPFNEGDVIIIYSPALDLSGYGYNEKEAKESFEITLEEFLNYIIEKGIRRANQDLMIQTRKAATFKQ